MRAPRLPLLLITSLAIACGDDADDGDGMNVDGPPQCNTADYLAFDAANHANQDIRVQAYHDMLALLDEAVADPSLASEKLTATEMLYENSASLRDKVMERLDDHFADSPAVGAELDAEIMDALDSGKTSTSALELSIIKETVDKSLIHFFYLSVYHEMVLGQREKWDEAFGYFGAPSDNDEGTRKGLAAVATKRDGTNNTTLAAEVFNGLVDGSCDLAKALDASGSDTVDVATDADLSARVASIDGALQKVLAYSAGHEAFEMDELQSEFGQNPSAEDIEEMWIALAELDPYFAPLERLMLDRGGESETRANRIRDALDTAWADPSGAWVTQIDAASIVSDLEAEYSIDVRG